MSTTERDDLVKQLRSKKRDESQAALAIIKERGWLTDGTLRGTQIYGAKLQNTDLRNADLAGCTLSGTVFQGADLSGADFSGADMIDTDLRGANARQTRFVGVDAIACKTSMGDFTDADLTGATFGNGTFSFTRLHHTILHDTDLNNAIFDNTILSELDLSTVRNLETVRHYGPSDVGTGTLLRSAGVELDFWRGCGVEERLLQQLPGLQQTPPLFYPAYVAYSRPDRPFALAVTEALRKVGVRCWPHEHQLEEHVDFYHALSLGNRADDRVLVVCSDAALASWWLPREMDAATAREQAADGAPATSLMLMITDDSVANAPADLQAALHAYPRFDFSELDSKVEFDVTLEPIIKALRRLER